MNFSYEELYSNFGQFDTFLTLTFEYNSDEFKKFGHELMGTFFYTLQEREALEKILNQIPIPRSDGKVKFIPSELEDISDEDKTFLDKYGIQASSVKSVVYVNRERENRFNIAKRKNIENQIFINAPTFSGWEELNRNSIRLFKFSL